jgi:hypothetical protein
MEYLPGLDPRRWIERARTSTSAADITTRTIAPLQDARTEMSVGAAKPATTAHLPDVDFSRVRAVIAQLAEGLAFLHARGVIHRDIKPSNSMVMPGGALKLLDFGLALERSRAEGELAREGRLVGTAAYLAPEYVERLTISPAMDVYSLGVLAFELVTGAPPFGGTIHVLARLGQRVVMPRASTIQHHVPNDLDDLIDHMLATDPLHRPTALDVAARLTGEPTEARPVRRAGRFVGREAELALIAPSLTDREPCGRLVLVTGPSGVGKTALVDQALGRGRTQGLLAWRGRCHDRERVPYRAFDCILDDLATELAGNPQLATTIDHAAALARVFPVLGARLGAGEVPPAEDLRVERERALHAIVQLFDRVLGAQRGCIVIDDLQWADDDSLELLALLVHRTARPLAIVATWTVDGDRPTELNALLERVANAAVVIEVPAMTRAELAELIGALAPATPVERLHAAAQLSAGSPYLAELIGCELAEAGLGDPHDAEQRRLDRLTVAERIVAEIAALAGGGATFEQLRALAGLPGVELQTALRGLEDGRVVRTAPSASGDPVYVFYHQRLRAAAHAAMSPEARRALHLRFADQLERDRGAPDQIAYHAQHAGESRRAARWAIAAGDAARHQLAWALAADWYGRALELLAAARPGPALRRTDSTSEWIAPQDLRAKRADSLLLAGKLAAAAAEFATLAGDGVDGDRWWVRAAESHIKLGELERGLAILDGVLERRGAARAHVRAASAVRVAGLAARWIAPAALRPRRTPDVVLAAAYRVIASFLSTPYPLEAFEYVLRGIELAARGNDRGTHGLGMAMLAAYLSTGSLGRFGDRAIARAHQLVAASGEPYPRMVAAGAAGIIAALRGRWSEMRTAHEDGAQICRRLGLERTWEASFLRGYWALGELYAGEPTRALALLGELADASDDLLSRALLGSYRGRALVLEGNLDSAREVLREIERVPAAQRGLTGIYRRVFAGELALAEADWARATVIAEELTRTARGEWLSVMPAVSAMIDVLYATAEIGTRERAAAQRARRRARALYRRGRASFYAATALRLWAQAEERLGNGAAARRVLARATSVAADRGGKLDRLAIAALAGERVDAGPLAAALGWSTGGVIRS